MYSFVISLIDNKQFAKTQAKRIKNCSQIFTACLAIFTVQKFAFAKLMVVALNISNKIFIKIKLMRILIVGNSAHIY